MTMLGACILATMVLSLTFVTVAVLAAVASIAEASLYDKHDHRRAIWEERDALRILRARYAEGLVSNAEYRRLCLELEVGHEV